MKTLRKAVLLLAMLSLLGSAGVVPLCASCGPKVMDCCKRDPSRPESLSQSPCCDFRMSATVEPHPARLTSLDSQRLQDEAPPVLSHVARRSAQAAVFLPPSASTEGTISDTSPPLFLLNTSFLC